MKKRRIYNQTSLFGPLWAYLVVISPPQSVKKEIARIKKDLNSIQNIGERNLHSIAHITLTEKLTDDESFPFMIKELLTDKASFEININGWDYFDHGSSITVYLKVQYPDPVIELMSAVKARSKTPHLTLVKKIPHTTFEKLIPHLGRLDYSRNWICTEVNVLKKKMSEKHLGFRESFKIPLSRTGDSYAH